MEILMNILKEILTPALVFVLLGVLMGVLLAVATKVFSVKTDERAEAIKNILPGANCGGCGFAGCSALAEAIAKGDAKVSACTVGGGEVAAKVAEIMGVEAQAAVKMRAQVMCSGTLSNAKQKYVYVGADDCAAAARLGGGAKSCPAGCIGLGTCAAHCPFGAINVENGIAVVDPKKCRGCGVCVAHCPKGIIKLIPAEANAWVGCSCYDAGKLTRTYCDVGCIGCKLCTRVCESGAITVDGNVAKIDYNKCTFCGKCAEKCPRKIIKL